MLWFFSLHISFTKFIWTTKRISGLHLYKFPEQIRELYHCIPSDFFTAILFSSLLSFFFEIKNIYSDTHSTMQAGEWCKNFTWQTNFRKFSESLIWSNRVWGNWWLIIWLEIAVRSSAMDFWRVIFQTDSKKWMFGSFLNSRFQNLSDSVLLQKYQPLFKLEF